MSWPTRARARDVVVAGPPDEALLHAVVLLRHLGAHITRLDAEAGTLEARLRRWLWPTSIRLRAAAEGTETTRVSLESDALGGGLMFRRFRGGLLQLTGRPA
ncbi:MAG TPA: hypothetical protein VNF03_06215 [Patescibacteria group bacterium]|jgi:hypothetical protein|nr:hypothetical protein [Patescibacteria group bacterium]